MFSSFSLTSRWWKNNNNYINCVIATANRLKLKTVMDSIANLISEERDVLYIRGQEKEQTKFVNNLLEKSVWTIDQIADIAGVSVDFIQTVKKKLEDKK